MTSRSVISDKKNHDMDKYSSNLLKNISYHLYITQTNKNRNLNLYIMTFQTIYHRSHTMISKIQNTSKTGQFVRMELDSHTDTIVSGSYCVVLSYTERESDVTPYNSSYSPAKGVPIVHAATGW